MVITATHADEGNVENQAYWLDISPDSVQVVLDGSHNLHFDDPGAVTELILCMLDSVGSDTNMRSTEPYPIGARQLGSSDEGGRHAVTVMARSGLAGAGTA